MREETILSPSQVSGYIKSWMDRDRLLSGLLVRGELSNYKMYPSGHHYFTLKDSQGALRCVMFRGDAASLRVRPENGMQVIAAGRITVFPRDGQYQLYCVRLTPEGAGDLHVAFEQLKEKLLREGLFDQSRKKPLPAFPGTIALITSPAGAAVRDIIQIASRRNPYVQIILYPALVQGASAAPSIVNGIHALERQGVDVMIVGRGGGSIEDLWAFNEESVARAIFACRTPVISAVGHETDVTIADYVADLRAPTPSAAAELAVFDYHLFEQQCIAAAQQMTKRMEQKAEQYAYRLEQFRLRLQLHSPQSQLNERRQYLEDARVKMARQMEKKVSDLRHRLELVCSRMEGLSPLKKISGGYGFVTDADGKRVETVTGLQAGDTLTVRLPDGRVEAEIREVYQENLPG